MRGDGFKIWEWRWGRLAIWFDLKVWGLGIVLGDFEDGWRGECMFHALFAKVHVGPVELEGAAYLPPGKLVDVGGYQG